MGNRKSKKKELNVEHITSTFKINTAKCCFNCPFKLYADEDGKIIFGCGNIITNTIIVLPSYDIKASIDYETMLTITENVYNEITGRRLLEDYYITRGIKCFNKTNFTIEKEAIKHCVSNLWYEIGRIQPKKIIVFDKYTYDFISPFENRISINIIKVISPGVMYYDNDNLKKMFYSDFAKAIAVL